MQVDPYLHYDGNCEAAFKFYEKNLGGKIEMTMTFGESPMADQVPAAHRDKVMHSRIMIGSQVLMGSDAPPSCYEKMNGFSVTIGIQDPAEAERKVLADRARKTPGAGPTM